MEVLKQLENQGYLDLYFGDESHFGMTPCVPYAWQHKSAPVLLPAGRNRFLNVVGLINKSNNFVYEVHQTTFNSEKAIAFLDKFAAKTRKKTVVVLDNAPIHKSKKFLRRIKYWRDKMDLYIFFLPPYSPELNLIEILWKRIKYQWMPWEAYNSFQSLSENLTKILNNMGTKYDIKYF